MNFNKHSLETQHAFLSGSKYHWINYDLEKLESTFKKYLAVQKGTELHEFAKICIELKQRLPKSRNSLNQFVNDAIGYRMIPEQTLFYSYNAYGTPDAISFYKKSLRIHDLKTGVTRVSMNQLEIYAALFCLEYKYDPSSINIELRIYQSNEIIYHIPENDRITDIMDKIVIFDKKIEEIMIKEGLLDE